MARANIALVDGELARKALDRAKDAGCAYSEYIRAHFQSTGSLAPGCDAKDLIAWYQTNEPEKWGAKGGKVPQKEDSNMAGQTAVVADLGCPKCKELLPNHPFYWNTLREPLVRNSLSRRDNKTYICNDCGTAEAMADYNETSDRIERVNQLPVPPPKG